MPPYQNLPLSPAELAYLHASLTAQPPIRPDARSPTQFRPLVAERDILPAANGSARICFADGTEAVVGVKAEVEPTQRGRGGFGAEGARGGGSGSRGREGSDQDGEEGGGGPARGRDEWVEVAIDLPGLRDDDALPTFLAAMLSEALLADPALKDRLYINARFHWRLYIDVLPPPRPLPTESLWLTDAIRSSSSPNPSPTRSPCSASPPTSPSSPPACRP